MKIRMQLDKLSSILLLIIKKSSSIIGSRSTQESNLIRTRKGINLKDRDFSPR